MKELGNIFLSWRKGEGARRHIIGIIKKNKTDGTRFHYFQEAVKIARLEGFAPYTEFPDISKMYTNKVLETFGQRLFKTERSDSLDFLNFWEIDSKYKNDKYYLLAHTMGLTPTDNFEFLVDYHPVKNLKFITDLAGLSHLKLNPATLVVGDILTIKFEDDNEYDENAVAVFKGDSKVGYIKQIHNRVFHKKRGSGINIVVKAVETNGFLKRVFVRVGFDTDLM